MAGKKVVRYRRKPKAAAIIFGIVLVYIVCFIVIYVSKAKVQTYEVEVGSLMNNASFTAVALRQEEVYNSSYSGDINYYQREGTRVMTGDTVYTVDETGRVSDILEEMAMHFQMRILQSLRIHLLITRLSMQTVDSVQFMISSQILMQLYYSLLMRILWPILIQL